MCMVAGSRPVLVIVWEWHIDLVLLCGCSGALEYPTTTSGGWINESLLLIYIHHWWSGPASHRNKTKTENNNTHSMSLYLFPWQSSLFTGNNSLETKQGQKNTASLMSKPDPENNTLPNNSRSKPQISYILSIPLTTFARFSLPHIILGTQKKLLSITLAPWAYQTAWAISHNLYPASVFMYCMPSRNKVMVFIYSADGASQGHERNCHDLEVVGSKTRSSWT